MNDSRNAMAGRLVNDVEENTISGVLLMLDVGGRQTLLIDRKSVV